MKEYKIGIIEDSPDELKAIIRTIYENLHTICNVSYVDYSCNLNCNNIVEKIKNDITDSKIMLLIIDNKLLVKDKCVIGTSIYEEIKKITSDFPVIIMTNYRDEAYKSDYVDPDKVYDKEKFFMNGEYTKEKINSIRLTMENYNKIKNEIISRQKKIIDEYTSQKNAADAQEKLNEILELDLEIKKYTPVETSYLEQLISPNRVKHVFDLLKEMNDMLD
ncbi:putative uncharacterized protein [Mycoplasma sp. CAG:956]|nr:putative uncharacterized protein [Mycoplasma sp. CAG:956]